MWRAGPWKGQRPIIYKLFSLPYQPRAALTKASRCHSYLSGNWWRHPVSWVPWPALGPGVLGMFSRSLPYHHPIHSRQSTNVESTLYCGSIILTVELAAALPSLPTHLNKSDFNYQRPVTTLPAPPVSRCSILYSGSWATFKASASWTMHDLLSILPPTSVCERKRTCAHVFNSIIKTV